MQNNNLNGALTGMLVAAAANWATYDDDTQRRLRNIRNDAEAALDEIRSLQSRGELIRLRIPVVQDFQVGLALASPALITPQVTPSVASAIRPNLGSLAPSAIGDLQWPPIVGSYDPSGMTSQPGDMTVMSLALCFEEVRAFVLGLTQPQPPMSMTKEQIYNAAHGLVQALDRIGITGPLTVAQYSAIWQSLFSAAVEGKAAPVPTRTDPHASIALPPVAAALHANVTVLPLGKPEIAAYPHEHQNTDRASKWRVLVSGPLPAMHGVAALRFGSMFLRGGKPYQPVISVSDGRLRVTSLSPDGFSLESSVPLQNETLDLSIAVTGGD